MAGQWPHATAQEARMRVSLAGKTSQADAVRSGWRQLLVMALLGWCATTAFADPPDRAARLSVVQGDVSFAPSGEDAWGDAVVNRPLTTGDRLLTGDGGRAELQLGGASIRLAEDSAFDFLNLDDQIAQIELTQGTLNLNVSSLDSGQSYEVDTPTVAFVVTQPGEYRIDLLQDADATRIS
ncbi:MAG: FecR domain-containing protein, partial [Stenotrophobium sp.]